MELSDTVKSAQRILQESRSNFVKVNSQNVVRLAKTINLEELKHETTKDSKVNKGVKLAQKTAVYIAYNSINFSFFPNKGSSRWFVSCDEDDEPQIVVGKDDEAHAIVYCLNKAQEKGMLDFLDGAKLASISEEKLKAVFRPHPDAGALPMLAERMICLQELGKAYLKIGCDNPASKILQEADGSCIRFIQILSNLCPSFRDSAEYKPLGKRIFFYKRAQLCASMLHSEGIVSFKDIAKLTVFADYRIPQLFRHVEVFRYREDLENQIKSCELLQSGSEAEIEIRAATIYAAQLLQVELCKLGSNVTSAQLDYYLWRTAVSLASNNCSIIPFHRCRSIYY